jgi:hypothetical protein
MFFLVYVSTDNHQRDTNSLVPFQPKSDAPQLAPQALHRASGLLVLMKTQMAGMKRRERQVKRLVSTWHEMPSFILNTVTAKKTRASLGNPVDVDNEGLLVDIEVQSIEEEAPTRADKRRDIDQFFHPAVSKTTGDKIKKYCTCKLCPYVSHTSVICLLNHFYQRQKEPRQRDHNFTPPSGGTSFCGLFANVLPLEFIYLSGTIPQMGSRCEV